MAVEQYEEGHDMAQEISGFYVRTLLIGLADTLSPEAIAGVLAQAGDTRSLDELGDIATWSSHAQFRRLLEATSRHAGLAGDLGDVGAHAATLDVDFAEIIRSFGSPQGVMVGGTGNNPLLPGRRYELIEVEPTEWIVKEWFTEEFDPYPEFCAFVARQYRAIPIYFGLAHARVIEEQCQCRGDAACVFRVIWDEMDDSKPRPEDLEVQVRVLQGRLTQLQAMVTDLASSERFEDILQGIVVSSLWALGAAGALLVVNAHAESPRRIYAQGMSDDDANRLADQLAADQGATPGIMSVEVSSARCRHGVLAIDERGGVFTSDSTETLHTYGLLAAAALDQVRAWEEARHQANTAQVLLRLAESLAEIVSTDEMAVKIAEAVPSLIDCDRVGVLLYDSQGETTNTEGLRLVASHGYPEEAVKELREKYVEDSTLNPDTVSEYGILRTSISDVGTVTSVSAPITSGWTLIGYIVAGVTTEPERLTVTPRLAERLKGLAAQASIAISNARMLDHIRYRALHDPLTGLPNRGLILDRAEQMLSRARRNYLPVAALYLDLDGFKDVNDRLGHAVGDRLLTAVTQRLVATMRESDTIGRLGGDEFVVLVDGSTMDAGPELVAERLLEVLREPFVLEGSTVGLNLSASIGIAAGTRSTADELLRDADTALYEAKGGGKNRYVMFQPEMQTAIQDRLILEMDLRDALGADQFFLVYQPIFNLASGRTTGVEALLRWRHPSRGVLQPDTFVPLLEESGVIVEVGRWVLFEACKQGSAWHALGHPVDVSVNVSARQLESDEIVDDLHRILTETSFTPESLTLEITETAIMRNVTAVIPRLAAIKAAGARIAIDDFGTGYSSLSYLQQFPVDTIKIDRSFIASMVDSPQSGALVRTLVQLGKTLGLETLAEGIEEIEQYSLLENVRCDSGQGYLIARPLEVDAVATFLATPAGLASPTPVPDAAT